MFMFLTQFNFGDKFALESDLAIFDETTRLAFQIILWLIVIVGLAGNAAVFIRIILAPSGKFAILKPFYRCALLSFATSDLLLLVASGSNTLMTVMFKTGLMWRLPNWTCGAIPYFQTVAVFSGSLTLAGIAVDRYRALKPKCPSGEEYPWPHAVFFNLLIWLIALAASYPVQGMYSIDILYIITPNATVYRGRFCMTQQSHAALVYTALFVTIFIPLAVIFVTVHVLLALNIWRRQEQSNKSQLPSGNDSQSTDFSTDPGEEGPNENNRLVYSVTPNSEDDDADDDSALKDLGVNVPVEEDARPFRLSDLAAEYSTDSGPQSEPETDDSRPCSRLGSSNSRTVYLDRSGGATSEDLVESTGTPDANHTFRPKSTFKGAEKVDTPDSEREEAGGDAYPKERMRKSEDCLLSRRYNLKFIQKGDLDAKKESLYFRSKSMMELSHSKDRPRILRQSSALTSTNTELPESDDEDLTPEAECPLTAPIDAVKALLEEYERSKRGFRTNPFLQDEREKMLIANKAMTISIDDDGQAARDANKDSEIRRKAWAETIAASIEYALALTDERLAPLLPVLVGGVRILTRHAHESALKHRLSDLFQRIARIYETILVVDK